MLKALFNKHRNLIIIWIALLLLVGSTAISNLQSKQNEAQVTILKTDIIKKEHMIREINTDISRKEYNANTVILTILLSGNQPDVVQSIKAHYLRTYPKLPADATTFDIARAIADDKESDLKKINDIYFLKDYQQEQIEEIKRANTRYVNLAFFLQIFSLVLIILFKK